MNCFWAPMVPLSVRLSFQARIRRAAWPILAVLLTGASAELRSQQPASLPDFQDRQTTADIRADSQERDQNVYHLHGHVVVTYRDMKLTADEASFNEFNGDVRAVGNVTFKDSTSRLEADEAFYNMQTGMGWFSNGRGALYAKVRPRPRMLITPNPFYVRARRLERRNETTYVAFHAHVTTCDCEATGWSISTRRARIEVGEKVVTHYSLFHLLRVPIFFTPATVNSIARRPRQTGFLLPHIGNSSQKGLILGGGFFWAINPSADLLLGLANYSIRGLARYGRFHAVPSA
ncbi:MAG: hypothetical protein LAN62_18600, partial [Acidobacteriia bacterium]|nr:hypothetical protein [Terriglobia bacterium]